MLRLLRVLWVLQRLRHWPRVCRQLGTCQLLLRGMRLPRQLPPTCRVIGRLIVGGLLKSACCVMGRLLRAACHVVLRQLCLARDVVRGLVVGRLLRSRLIVEACLVAGSSS